MNAVAKAPLAVIRSGTRKPAAVVPVNAVKPAAPRAAVGKAATVRPAPVKAVVAKPSIAKPAASKPGATRSTITAGITAGGAILPPLNIGRWLEEHRHHLKPPYASRRVWEDRDTIVTVVAGPCNRKDFHVNPTEELVYQLEGAASVRLVDAQRQSRVVPVRAGELFLIPAGVPHAITLPADGVAVLIERRRPAGEDDQVCFYCDRCGETVYEETFDVDAADRIRLIVEEFWSDATMRTCVHCGEVIQPSTVAGASVIPLDDREEVVDRPRRSDAARKRGPKAG